jgi:hypothetical protein
MKRGGKESLGLCHGQSPASWQGPPAAPQAPIFQDPLPTAAGYYAETGTGRDSGTFLLPPPPLHRTGRVRSGAETQTPVASRRASSRDGRACMEHTWRSLVCGGQPSPHKPRLVVSHSTCPPLSSSPHAHSFVLGTAVIKPNHG